VRDASRQDSEHERTLPDRPIKRQRQQLWPLLPIWSGACRWDEPTANNAPWYAGPHALFAQIETRRLECAGKALTKFKGTRAAPLRPRAAGSGGEILVSRAIALPLRWEEGPIQAA
jgi:hypothetical protein